MNEEKKLIVALDVASNDEMLQMLKKIHRPGCYVKVGMELYLQMVRTSFVYSSQKAIRFFLI
ncbi:hypothetical protein NBRC111894_2073 [Sporolactobacillus inulinus]|uniref:Orotidine 5'-phosphate decarboxylase domain-containing protein n=1 Tax=Sporolactobacillus inulinus TaxID=2078 RepID=A0A4Y1ZBW6_9BACL|nr:hypothetical protein NBRC111894_2073 [Sporolactobacillus inulinus]